jgi:very-short-patch-repair endonuclease
VSWLASRSRSPTPAQRILRDSERTKLERRLWRTLELAGLPLPDELEYQFALSIGRKWRSDGYYRAARLLVEVDGGSWVGGRHNHPSGFEEDCRKLSTAATLGYRVVRVTGAMIARGEAVALIRTRAAASRGPAVNTCSYELCAARPERNGRCYAHQPGFVASCSVGEHCQCYEDGRRCCTCFALRPRWREINPNVFMPLEVMR